ncbi:IS200/IS605 family transposase, partial [Aerococcus viridans]
ISFNPKHAASSIVKTLKGKSARLWFKAYPETKTMLWGGHLWTPSYFMATVGSMSKETVKKYIENQLTEYNDGRPRT